MPVGVSIQSHTPNSLKSSVNPSLPGSTCRNARCAGSMLFSLTCSQLHSHRVGARAIWWKPGRSKVSRIGKSGRLSGGPILGKDQPAMLMHRIGAVAEAVLEGAVGRLARRLEDRAVDIEEPAVIAAADARVANEA